MPFGKNDIKFGLYTFSKRAHTALKDYGIRSPKDLDALGRKQMRKIPGFGAESIKRVMEVRHEMFDEKGAVPDFMDMTESEEEVTNSIVDPDEYLKDVDASLQQAEVSMEPVRSLTITLTMGQNRLKARHFAWLDNVLAVKIDDTTGRLHTDFNDLFAMFVRNTKAGDSTKGGTVGVNNTPGGVPANGVSGPVRQDFTPNLTPQATRQYSKR